MNEVFRVLTVAAIYIGTVIGAGFASGREIWEFFSQYGTAGTWGLFYSTLLLAVLGAKVMEWGRRIKAASYQDFLHSLAGKWAGRGGDLILTVFLLFLLGVMLAGSGALTVQLGGRWAWGCWGTALLAVLVLSRRLEGIKGVNLVFIPLLFIAGIILNLKTAPSSPAQLVPAAPAKGHWLLAALQYTAYNLVLALPVLVTLHRLHDNAAVLRRGGILGGVSLGVLAFLFHRVMAAAGGSGGELPLFVLTADWGGLWRYGYALVLWGELFSTLIAHGYGLATRIGPAESRYFTLSVAVLMVVAVIIGQVGFGRLIMVLYPFFGMVSFFLLLPLLLKPLPAPQKNPGRKRATRGSPISRFRAESR
ncbi:MAG: hypothetical protein GX036_00290 [Firmicutes bacterium]|jgi:uncharacterized membrane protein YkvI|nr:hypothetical protein [Bacillota bacterium]